MTLIKSCGPCESHRTGARVAPKCFFDFFAPSKPTAFLIHQSTSGTLSCCFHVTYDHFFCFSRLDGVISREFQAAMFRLSRAATATPAESRIRTRFRPRPVKTALSAPKCQRELRERAPRIYDRAQIPPNTFGRSEL